MAGQVNFRATVLSFRDVFGRSAKTLVSQLGFSYANAVDVARGNSGSSRETDVERVEIGALAAKILRFQHKANVTDTTAARFRIPKRVVDDPLVDRASLFDISMCTAGDLVLGRFHNTVCWQKFCRSQKIEQLR